MHLTLDIGNTQVKAAFFLEGQCLYYQSVLKEDLPLLNESYHPRLAIVSSVTDQAAEDFKTFFPEVQQWVSLTHQTPLPVQNDYQTPETLGMDRLSAAVGAWTLFPGQHTLVLDAGTCIKSDFMDAQGHYQGGSISPGIKMRFQALQAFTAHLPMVSFKDPFPLEGKTTEESIRSGVLQGTISEVEGLISLYKQRYNPLQTILTGGDARFFESRIKEPIFVVPELVHMGLNRILEYNVLEK